MRDETRSALWLGVFCALALLGAMLFYRSCLAADEVHFTILGQTEVGFGWRGTGGSSTIEWGTAPATYTSSQAGVTPAPLPVSSAGPFYEARISGLTENTRYYYRIDGGTEYAFKTPPPRGSAGFWFAEEADIGSSDQGSYRVPGTQTMIASDEAPDGYDVPDFVLAPGDLSYANNHGYASEDNHFNDVMVWSTSAAYMPQWGNHDGDGPSDDIREFEGRFILPGVTRTMTALVGPCVGGGTACNTDYDDWSWFDYGCVRFIGYPGHYASSSNSTITAAWGLSADSLMDAAENDPAIRYIVTFGHEPAWSTGNHSGNTTTRTRLNALRNGGVTGISAHSKYVLNINGHSHDYERFNPSLTAGLLNITGAGGGSTCEPRCYDKVPPTCTDDTLASVVYLNELTHLKVFVAADAIYGYVICGPSGSGGSTPCSSACTPGTVVDSWTIPSPVTTGVGDVAVARRALIPRPGWYDLAGRRLRAAPTRSGVYLHNGRVVRIAR